MLGKQNEVREPTELFREVLRSCGSFNLRKASRVVTQLYDDFLQPTGLRSTQIVLLVTLAAEGEMTIARLAQHMVTSPSTLSRNLLPLMRDKLVLSLSGKGRGKTLKLTGKGMKSLLASVPYWQKAQRQFLDLIGHSEWEDLNKKLSKTVIATRR
jgi:DNA-binding MarR family transcriptional regulator